MLRTGKMEAMSVKDFIMMVVVPAADIREAAEQVPPFDKEDTPPDSSDVQEKAPAETP